MPIRPEMRERYPRNWDEISLRARSRAGNRCEFCGRKNGDWIERKDQTAPAKPGQATDEQGIIYYKVVLTVAHMNHQPQDCRPENLKALCQPCHNQYDAPNRARVRAENRAIQAQNAAIQAGQLRLV